MSSALKASKKDDALLTSLGMKKRKISELKADQKVGFITYRQNSDDLSQQVPHVQKLLLQGPLQSGWVWKGGAEMDHNTLAALRFRNDILIKLDFVVHHCSSCDHLQIVEEESKDKVAAVVTYLRAIQKYLSVVSDLQQASEQLPQQVSFLNKSLDHQNYNSASYKAFCKLPFGFYHCQIWANFLHPR